MDDADFRLKGSVVTVIVIELYRYTPDTFVEQLQSQIERSPQLFDQAPVILSLEKFSVDNTSLEFNLLLAQCRACGLLPVAFRDNSTRYVHPVEDTGLALLPPSDLREKTRPAKARRPQSEPKPAPEASAEAKPAVAEVPAARPGKLITRPVRSGQQIYAEGADLIVMAAVSEGAEVLADGHIHVYGALRGRALAGIRGDESARIFCQSMDAQLLSIAGNFLVSDSIAEEFRQQPAQAYLQQDVLHVSAL
jgi:septum site-determining protein MinC